MNKFVGSLFAATIIALSSNVSCSPKPAYEPTSKDQARHVTPLTPSAPQPLLTEKVTEKTEPATPQVTTPVIEMFKGQAAQCAKAAPHSTAWDMQSCDDLERIKKGQKPANDTDDWLVKQRTPELAAWFDLQKKNASFAPKTLPAGKKTILSGLRSPSTARFTSEGIAIQCPDADTFIAVYGVDAKNAFNAEVHDVFCVGISLKDARGVVIDCGPLVTLRFALERDDRDGIATNLRLLCELPAKLLKL